MKRELMSLGLESVAKVMKCTKRPTEHKTTCENQVIFRILSQISNRLDH